MSHAFAQNQPLLRVTTSRAVPELELVELAQLELVLREAIRFPQRAVGPHMDCGSEVPIGWLPAAPRKKTPESLLLGLHLGRMETQPRTGTRPGLVLAGPRQSVRIRPTGCSGSRVRFGAATLNPPLPVNINKRCSMPARNSSDWTAERGASGQSS